MCEHVISTRLAFNMFKTKCFSTNNMLTGVMLGYDKHGKGRYLFTFNLDQACQTALDIWCIDACSHGLSSIQIILIRINLLRIKLLCISSL